MWNQPTEYPFPPYRQDYQRSCCLKLDSDETSLYRKHMYLNFPTKATVSTPTKHYGLWQRLQDPNQGLNTQPNAQIFLSIMKPTRRCFYFILLAADVEYHEKEGMSQKIFWGPWQNGWISITVMRLQEWPPCFPHLCHSVHVSSRELSFLRESLLSLFSLFLSRY